MLFYVPTTCVCVCVEHNQPKKQRSRWCRSSMVGIFLFPCCCLHLSFLHIDILLLLFVHGFRSGSILHWPRTEYTDKQTHRHFVQWTAAYLFSFKLPMVAQALYVEIKNWFWKCVRRTLWKKYIPEATSIGHNRLRLQCTTHVCVCVAIRCHWCATATQMICFPTESWLDRPGLSRSIHGWPKTSSQNNRCMTSPSCAVLYANQFDGG